LVGASLQACPPPHLRPNPATAAASRQQLAGSALFGVCLTVSRAGCACRVGSGASMPPVSLCCALRAPLGPCLPTTPSCSARSSRLWGSRRPASPRTATTPRAVDKGRPRWRLSLAAPSYLPRPSVAVRHTTSRRDGVPLPLPPWPGPPQTSRGEGPLGPYSQLALGSFSWTSRTLRLPSRARYASQHRMRSWAPTSCSVRPSNVP